MISVLSFPLGCFRHCFFLRKVITHHNFLHISTQIEKLLSDPFARQAVQVEVGGELNQGPLSCVPYGDVQVGIIPIVNANNFPVKIIL